jgi:hypothetical protein
MNFVAPAHARTVQLIGSDRPARQARNPSFAPGHGPSSPWPRTVRACAESTVAGSQRSDWRLNRRQQCGRYRELNFAKCPIKSTWQNAEHSTKSQILVVVPNDTICVAPFADICPVARDSSSVLGQVGKTHALSYFSYCICPLSLKSRRINVRHCSPETIHGCPVGTTIYYT